MTSWRSCNDGLSAGNWFTVVSHKSSNNHWTSSTSFIPTREKVVFSVGMRNAIWWKIASSFPNRMTEISGNVQFLLRSFINRKADLEMQETLRKLLYYLRTTLAYKSHLEPFGPLSTLMSGRLWLKVDVNLSALFGTASVASVELVYQIPWVNCGLVSAANSISHNEVAWVKSWSW